MKAFKYTLPILSLLFAASCQLDKNDDILEVSNEVNEICILAGDVEGDLTTRAYPFVSDFGIRFFNTDTLGIFSMKDGKQQTYQMTFPVNAADGVGVTSFNFTGGGWFMSSDFQYQAYCPYNYDNKDATALPLFYVGQKQVGNNNLNNLSSYYFVTSERAAPTNNRLSLTLYCRNSIAWCSLAAPAVASYKKLYLCAEEEAFAAKNTYNLETATFGTPSVKTQAISLALENISANTVGQTLDLFMVVCPVNFTGKVLRVVLVDTNDNKYVSTFNGTKREFKSNGIRKIASADMTAFTLDNSFQIPDDGSSLLNDGITGSAPDFIPVGGSTNQPD